MFELFYALFYFWDSIAEQGKAQLALKNLKNQFGDQREDSLTSLNV